MSNDQPSPLQPPANTLQPAPQNGWGVAALVMGILQFFCLGMIGSILAIVFGVLGRKKAEQGLATNGGIATAGFWLGIAGVILYALAILAIAILAATGEWHWSFRAG